MMLEASEMLSAISKLQYLGTLSRCEALCQFDDLCDQVGITNTTNLNRIDLGLLT